MIYFSRNPENKAIGWTDTVLACAMRKPMLLSCGHLADIETLNKLQKKECVICRKSFAKTQVLPVTRFATMLTKENGQWTAQIVDALREPLDGTVLYHRCGEFFNVSSMRKLYGVEGEKLEDVKQHTIGRSCSRCLRPFTNLFPCYPQSVIETEHTFGNLAQLSSYVASN